MAKNLMIVFGGMSSEHEVSCVSAATVVKAINTEKYNVYLVGITKDGQWIYTDSVASIESGLWKKGTTRATLTPDTKHELLLSEDGVVKKIIPIDVAFPVMHGLFGEDGTIQGLFELAHLPYVGCGHLSSAVTMDKFFTKVIADHAGVAQAAFVPVYREDLEDMDSVVARIEEEREYPVFIKPSNAGSSVGITKAHDRQELIKGLRIAAEQDTKILVEEAISGREVECAVYGHGKNIFAAAVGEVVAAAEFYDYDAKYNNAESKTVINPELPEGKLEEIKEKAVQIFRACDGFGFSRVDFFLENDTNRVVFNEINTIPGHTAISMYPMLMKAAGHDMSEYVEGLIEMAFERSYGAAKN
ncbi:MAG: D-alanine--D-alanine ligase [Lachnospiraceae bacterium]|nr:D-alanine--D-alanine ligase [Lachnospiraceae bacterium]